MRLCYLHLTRYPTRLANPVQVMNMCAAMAELGHDLTLVIRASEGAEPGFERSLYDQYGIPESFALRAIGHHPLLARGYLQHRELGRLLRELRPDLLYSRTTRFASLWTAAGTPYVYETHAMPSHNPRLGRTKRTLLSRNFRRLVVITRALAADFQSVFPELPSDSIVVAPDAASPRCSEPRRENKTDPFPVRPGLSGGRTPAWPNARDRFSPDHGEFPRKRIGPGRESGEFRAGYVGHLYPGKGMETIAALAPRLSDVRFDIVGGTSGDIAAWRQRTAGIGNIRFAGYVPHRDVCRHIADFDLALAPFGRRVETRDREISRWFSPLKIFEYMAQGRTIVAADLPVLREVLEHGRNAWLVPPEDIEAWVDAIRRLREDPELRTRLGRAAFKDFKRRYTWTARARRVLENLPDEAPRSGTAGL